MNTDLIKRLREEATLDANGGYANDAAIKTQAADALEASERKPLTELQIDAIPFRDGQDYIETVDITDALRLFARDIEAAHLIGENT